MIADLGVSRSQVATAYLVGTLLGAAAMPLVGTALERYGVRRTMAAVGAVFGSVLLGLSFVTGLVGLTAGFVGIRMMGQGALGLVATTATALWFVRRRGTVVGTVSAVGAAGISLAPVALERLVASEGWRTAWVVEGLLVWAVVLPVALLGMRDRPASLGQVPDGRAVAGEQQHAEWGLTRSAAVRHGWFWVVCAAVAVTGMLSTAVGFHQISLLGERGLSPAAAAANFVPQTGGSIRSLEAASSPRAFGTLHLGSIRGLVALVSVGSTAFGPLLFALVQASTGSYRPVLLASAALPLLVAVAGCVVRAPAPGAPGVSAPVQDGADGALDLRPPR